MYGHLVKWTIMSIEKIARNKEILAKHRAGLSYSDLANEYEISIPRVRQILQKERAYGLSKPSMIFEIKQSCEDFNAADGMLFRILNALHNERIDIHGRWLKLSREEMLSIRGIGQQAVDILMHAQEIAKK